LKSSPEKSGLNLSIKISAILGDRLLHYSAIQEHKGVTQLLIQSGANIDSKNNKEQIPLQTAAMFNNLGAAKSLTAARSNISSKDKAMSPLSIENIATSF